ncbi:hypothetical protein GCM10010210_33710 [Pseudonocardia hydrocarbonoxydans]|uniref:Uncharacterized protein n=1 Tax=Pseudonocardia hydrocarbonoxydans TaxID=76726 RepID=A0A4Y3WIJ4_9PSEU|nr:hypothetical protein PHY01_06210 [Pseudonocardia hydrocarbonoxydans]
MIGVGRPVQGDPDRPVPRSAGAPGEDERERREQDSEKTGHDGPPYAGANRVRFERSTAGLPPSQPRIVGSRGSGRLYATGTPPAPPADAGPRTRSGATTRPAARSAPDTDLTDTDTDPRSPPCVPTSPPSSSSPC